MKYPKIIIQTCDLYKNVLEANKYTMDKFGCADMDVTVLGYSKPDFDLGSWKFISMGVDRGPQFFSDDIKPFFDTFDDEYFIYMNDDIVLIDDFNSSFFEEIISVVKDIPNFGRIWLGETPADFYGGCDIIKDFGEYQLGEIFQESMYRLSLQFSLWKTSYFKRYIRPGLNPWQWELRDDAKHDGATILLPIKNRVFTFGHVFSKCRVINNWAKDMYGNMWLPEDDINKIIEIFNKHKIYQTKSNVIFGNDLTSNVIKI